MKLLILSCFTGEGHNSAANAIAEECHRQGAVAEIVDPVRFRGKRAQKWVSNTYNEIIRTAPRAFGVIYQVGALYDATGLRSPVYWANRLYAPALWEYIRDNQFDAVVSTHLYGMEALTAIRKQFSIDIPTFGVLTDYTVIPFFAETELHGYFIPHPSLQATMVNKGMKRSAIYATGIPVLQKFSQLLTKSEARKQLKLSGCQRVFAVMSGGIGGGNVAGLCDALLVALCPEDRVLVLVGHNRSLAERLQTRYPNDSRLQIVPFTKEVALYMKAADVLLSKPGGLSSTEAAVLEVPLVHINGIPGCETANISFFAQNGMALPAKNAREGARLALQISGNPELAASLCQQQRVTVPKHAAKEIVQIIQHFRTQSKG